MERTERELMELKNQFFNPKFAKDVWRGEMQRMAATFAIEPEPQYDKDGNQTYESKVEKKCYDDIMKQYGFVPEFLLVIRCQAVLGRSSTPAATFIRDSIGLKPIDESKIDHKMLNPYEDLSDEELELLRLHRENKDKDVIEVSDDTNRK